MKAPKSDGLRCFKDPTYPLVLLENCFFYLNYVDLFQLMDLIKHNNPKFVCFCILALSISFVFVQGISNSHFNFSVEASQGILRTV